MSYLARRFALITLSLAVLSMIPAAGWSDNKPLEPHQPGWERWFKLDWEAGDWKGHAVVQGYLYNTSPKTIGEVQLLVDALDTSGSILAQKVNWVPGSQMEPFSRRYFVADVPLVQIAPQQAAQYRVRVYSYTELQAPGQKR
ncbi:MAG: hypothetical protein AUI04_14955 [Candidatus Rokubacteria bacterium 13_2_20CM_2_64_8]|nr:MAG: hypothetical protein AUI04_14955 [Candidatus Rokubacteria bacterium 13_2_20CM_2_64_8]